MSLTKSHPPPLPKQHALAKMSDLLMKFASHKTMTRNELNEKLNECCATCHHPFGKDAKPGRKQGYFMRHAYMEEFEACRFCGADLALNFDKSSRK